MTEFTYIFSFPKAFPYYYFCGDKFKFINRSLVITLVFASDLSLFIDNDNFEDRIDFFNETGLSMRHYLLT